MTEDVNNAVAALVNAIYDADLGTVRAVQVHIQDSGEHPYQVTVTEEELPLAGLATTAPRS